MLISLLTAYHRGGWTLEQVRPTLEMLFERQYTLTETVTRQTRYDDHNQPYEYTICKVKLVNFDLSHLPVYVLDEDGMHLYAVYMATLGNRPDLFPTSEYPNASTKGDYLDYDVPPEALEDELFAAMLKEAEKYLGFPYVWGGKNFERPAVQEMLLQVRQGKIQCIVVKDLSRLGRDYLTVGNYISRVFPFLRVRFIAVNDGIDSIRPSDVDSLDTSYRTLLYDLYSRDLSRKVRSALCLRAKRGECLSTYAPYGYTKDLKRKNHLVTDPPAAEIVRRIFHMVADGKSAVQAAQIRNRECVPTPLHCKRAVGSCSNRKRFWIFAARACRNRSNEL